MKSLDDIVKGLTAKTAVSDEQLNSRYIPSLPSILPITIKKVRKVILDARSIPVVHRKIDLAVPRGDIVVKAKRSYSKINRSSTYWVDSGWERRPNNTLIGHYVVQKDLYPGSIELSRSKVTPASYFVYLPADVNLTGPHEPCFMYKGKVDGLKKYWIHFSEEPVDIDSGIIQIQRDLAETISKK